MQKAVHFRKNPTCNMFFVTTGQWKEDLSDHKSIMDLGQNTLKDANLFSDIKYRALGVNEINDLYRASKNRLSAQVFFSTKATLPTIPGVEVAYIGVLPLEEFKTLIIDEDGIIKNVFEDNIRDFQEIKNPVNASIDSTLKSESFSLFPLLNNGVTIVANKIRPTGDSLFIEDYQIVNGCQTSNVLKENLGNDKLKKISIPVKLIITTDEDIKNTITIATNSQTPIRREQLSALTKFQHDLESYYAARTDIERLYYERRQNQYASTDIAKTRIISIQVQIKAFASIFFNRPHQVTSYFGDLTKNIATDTADIFNPRHTCLPYYLSGVIYYKLESLFRNGTIDSKYKKFRFFILMAFFSSIIKTKITNAELVNEKIIERNLASLTNVLKNPTETINYFQAVVRHLEKIKFDTEDKDALKQSTTTEKIMTLIKA